MKRRSWGGAVCVAGVLVIACSSNDEPSSLESAFAGDASVDAEASVGVDDAGDTSDSADSSDPCAACKAPDDVCVAGSLSYTKTTCPNHACVFTLNTASCKVACGSTAKGKATCSGTNAIGAFDSADEKGLHGWACDQDTPWAASEIHAYFDGPAGAPSAKGIPGILAADVSEKAVNDLCGGENHRFNFTPAEAKAAGGVGPGVHSVWAYAISGGAGESNLTLNTAPLNMPIPATSISATYKPGTEHKVWAKVGGQNGGGYAYTPSIMQRGGEFHLWACNFDGVHLGDSIGYSHSADGVTWSAPATVLYMPAANQGVLEHTCDPSVIRFKPPGSMATYYYLFYSALLYGTGTVNGVSRATSPTGPFAHYMGGDPKNDANWVVDPGTTHPFFIQKPPTPCGSTPGCYGLGEPTVVLKGDTITMWYNLANDPDPKKVGVWMTTSKDGVTWSAPVMTNRASQSVDIKWDPASQQYVMFGLQKEYSADAEFQVKVSADGITWNSVGTPVQIPDYAAEFGVSGDEHGFVHGGKTLFGFAAPYDLMGNKRCVEGQCEIFVSALDVVWK